MGAQIGKRAIVTGGGMAGLSAAAALAGRFGEVIVLDRDTLPDDAAVRMGAGQGAHLHQLLKAGEQALEKLLPGVTDGFYAAGARRMRVGRDVKVFDFGGWMDECDAGFDVTSLSRPAYEGVVRARVAALPGVSIRSETPVKRFVVSDGRCTGVELEDGAVIDADLVVDASGMTAPLIGQLVAEGHAAFETEEVRINVAYSTVRFRQPEKWRGEATGFFLLPGPPGTRFGFLLPIEGDQWILSVGARGKNSPPRTLAEMLAYAEQFDPAVFERVRDAEPASELKTFRKPTATRRKIWEAGSRWPERLLPIGDTLSSVNPTYGQGMTVAACVAEALAEQLDKRIADGAGLDGLAGEYLAAAGEISGRAWSLSINSDYVYEETEGERPAAYAMNRAVAATLRKLADEDLEFRTLRYRLVHMVDSANALREGPMGIKFFTALQGSMA
jgi:2-polyprenyl-6-methoxyphenol hydroxylase-like FAD-dependent oxidoreductase